MSAFLGPVERLVLLRDGYYHADPRAGRRAAMILALDRGSAPASVARSARCARATVYYWLRRYLEHRDPAALRGAHSSAGTPPPKRGLPRRRRIRG